MVKCHNALEPSFVSNFIKGTTGGNGLEGGKFFLITYSFIGAVSSIQYSNQKQLFYQLLVLTTIL
jgi:hypothetical protein